MTVVEQGCRTCDCTRISKTTLRIRSVFLSTQEEGSAWMDCDVHTFKVLDGGWEIQRTVDETPCGAGNLDAFCGTIAYFEAGAVIRDLPGVPEPARELLRECVRGIIQAESYLTTERGYGSLGGYDAAFARMYANQCRFYAYPDDTSPPWSVYIGSYRRTEGLFHRRKAYVIDRQTDDCMRVSGTFCDSFHEIHMDLALSPTGGQIQTATAQFLRSPGPPCSYCVRHAATLPGKSVATLSKRELGALLGGAEGCAHMVDIAGEMVAAAGRIVAE
ncbi:DUF2889 domain-containing protein [Desulfosarcina sp. OttesenSCG-928-G10]|nr:DUF2889 domain-containing protein [Desulfosarcina sp. OttesenSCG-928-G10]